MTLKYVCMEAYKDILHYQTASEQGFVAFKNNVGNSFNVLSKLKII